MYNYNEEKPKIFTDEGQRSFILTRDHVHKLLNVSGAVTMDKATKLQTGAEDTWTLMAFVDRMVELGEIREITENMDVAGQHRVFVKR